MRLYWPKAEALDGRWKAPPLQRDPVPVTVAMQFGGCDGKVPNCIPIVKGWNDTVRLYRPRAEILRDTWTFPEAQPAS